MNWTKRPHRASGVTLIEVLVATMILAVGLLGLAALLGNAMQSNQHASARTQAVFLASDLMDRMRANKSNSEDYVSAFMEDPPECERDWTPSASADMATNDLSEWRNQISCYLPDGNADIRGADDRYTVRIRWHDLDSSDSEQVELSSEL